MPVLGKCIKKDANRNVCLSRSRYYVKQCVYKKNTFHTLLKWISVYSEAPEIVPFVDPLYLGDYMLATVF